MATRYHIGAKALRSTIASYAKRFDLLEVQPTLAPGSSPDAPRANPSIATLRRWRKEVPPHFEFAVIAGPHLARLRPTAEFDMELEVARKAIDALRARCFVLRTPADVTPTRLWRTRIEGLFKLFPRDATYLVWEPSGLWETADAAALGKRIDVIVAVDAAREAVPAGPVTYSRLRALGTTHTFGTAALERVVASIGTRHDAYVVFETAGALRECKRLRAAVQRGPVESGSTRLLRPRPTLRVGDDEQE